MGADNNKDSIQYSSVFDWADSTSRYLPSDLSHALYPYHWAGQYTSLRPPKGLHFLSEIILNKA